MKTLRPLWALALGAALVFVLACGGDSNDDSAAGDSGGSGGVAAPLDLASTTSKLDELKSFRFDMAMKIDVPMSSSGSAEDDMFGAALLGLLGDIKAEGAYVAPDSMQVTMSMAGQEFGIVQIGNDAWTKLGSSWTKTTAAAAGLDLGSSPTELITEFIPQEVLSGAKTKKETVNGVSTTRYTFDKAALEKLAADMGESTGDFASLTDANLDVWLNSDNIPVKMAMKMNGKDESGGNIAITLDLNVKDINSSSVQVKPPV